MLKDLLTPISPVLKHLLTTGFFSIGMFNRLTPFSTPVTRCCFSLLATRGERGKRYEAAPLERAPFWPVNGANDALKNLGREVNCEISPRYAKFCWIQRNFSAKFCGKISPQNFAGISKDSLQNFSTKFCGEDLPRIFSWFYKTLPNLSETLQNSLRIGSMISAFLADIQSLHF